MPIYEYVCSDCKLKFEMLRPMRQAEEDALCPGCGACAKRVLSVFSRSSEGSLVPDVSGGASACSTCSSNTCSTCSLG